MKDIATLEDLPKPSSGISLQIECDNISAMEKVGAHLSKIGWKWATGCDPLCNEKDCFDIFRSTLARFWILDRKLKHSPEAYGVKIVLKASDLVSACQTELKADLKTLNSDGRMTCAACSGRIAEPFPNIRHCPICEP